MSAPRPTRLVVLGSILIDLVLDIPALPERGGDVLAQEVGYRPGGGFNIASAASRLGLPTLYAGPYGTGPMGDRVAQALAEDGVDVVFAPNPDQDTGYCITLVDPDGERTFVTVTGADGVVDGDALASLVYQRDDAVYVSGYDLAYVASGPVLAHHVGAIPGQSDGGPLLVLDPSPLVTQTSDDVWAWVLPRADVITCNAHEFSVIGPLLTRYGSTAVVVHRDGAAGATLQLPDQPPVVVAGYPVEAVDSNGAGDVHVGAMLAGLAEGLEWPAAVDLANRAAAFSVTRRGGANGPTPDELAVFGAALR
jgi:ribokinase